MQIELLAVLFLKVFVHSTALHLVDLGRQPVVGTLVTLSRGHRLAEGLSSEDGIILLLCAHDAAVGRGWPCFMVWVGPLKRHLLPCCPIEWAIAVLGEELTAEQITII